MVAQKFSLVMAALISACAQSAPPQDVNKDPVLLSASISPARDGQDCPCKSALMQYAAYQEIGEDVFQLISGNFSILNKEKLTLPVAVQGNLIFADHAVTLSISCSTP